MSRHSQVETLERRSLLSAPPVLVGNPIFAGVGGITFPASNALSGDFPDVIVNDQTVIPGTYAGDGAGTVGPATPGTGQFKLVLTGYSSHGILTGKLYANIAGKGLVTVKINNAAQFTASGGFSVHVANNGFDGKIKGDFKYGDTRFVGTITGTYNGKTISLNDDLAKR